MLTSSIVKSRSLQKVNEKSFSKQFSHRKGWHNLYYTRYTAWIIKIRAEQNVNINCGLRCEKKVPKRAAAHKIVFFVIVV